MFSLSDAVMVANELGVSFDNFSIQDFITGLNIELEHGYINPINDLIMTAKIALAHLMEFPNYYNEEYGLPALERDLKRRMEES